MLKFIIANLICLQLDLAEPCNLRPYRTFLKTSAVHIYASKDLRIRGHQRCPQNFIILASFSLLACVGQLVYTKCDGFRVLAFHTWSHFPPTVPRTRRGHHKCIWLACPFVFAVSMLFLAPVLYFWRVRNGAKTSPSSFTQVGLDAQNLDECHNILCVIRIISRQKASLDLLDLL